MNLRGRLRSTLVNKRLFLSAVVQEEKLLAFINLIKPVAIVEDLVRIGGCGDGGYLVPDVLDGVVACFSPGVANKASFELELLRRGISCFLADFSVDIPIVLVDYENVNFTKKFLGAKEDMITVSLESWFKQHAPEKGDCLLQMDIEGSEFSVIADTSHEVFNRFRIIIIEFHSMDRIFSKDCYAFVTAAFEKLKKNFTVVHIHPNNSAPAVKCHGINIPPTFEMTLLRNDWVNPVEGKPVQFPHPLDQRCVSRNPDLILDDLFES